MNFDDLTARLAMGVARRSTRRGFLGTLGKAALVVGGGGLVMGRAEERAFGLHECGHTGLSANCVNDFCPDVFGRCWFAADCCSNGQIKKICDCCSPAYPNVHGYCPDGFNVRCIVTSCGRHPKEPRPALIRIIGDTPSLTAMSMARTLPGGAPSAVLVATDSSFDDGYVAPGMARSFGTNIHLARRGFVESHVLDTLQNAGVRDVWVMTEPDPELDALVAGRGFRVRRLPGRDAAERAAASVYERGRRTPITAGVVVTPAMNEAARWANLAAASAAAALDMAFTVVLTNTAPAVSALVDAGVSRTVVVGDLLSEADARSLPGGQPVRIGGDPSNAAAVTLRALTAVAGRVPPEWMLVSGAPGQHGVALAAAGTRITAVTAGEAMAPPTFRVIEDLALDIRTMWAAGTPGAVSDQVYMTTEDALKAYDRDLYIGGSGIHLGPGE